MSWSVPGCVDGWETLRAKFGSMTMAQILAPAIAYAEDGFPVSEVIAQSWRSSTSNLAACFLPGGKSPGIGAVFKNPDLARKSGHIPNPILGKNICPARLLKAYDELLSRP
ncbi:MAG: gamma-glutamyltransferase [Isosphaeraceae bacterium]